MISSIMQLLIRILSAPPKKNLFLENKWLKDNSNVKDDPYETPIFAYNKEMDQLMEANIISSNVEEEDSTTCPNGKTMELNDQEKTQCQRQHAQKMP